ncbi:hypothetical protein OESDEN_23129 [Oesophagostomum dentatum]|uniref:Transposable element Tc3 transposase-like DNA-binding HTH domain-containing protein n=1 Tax=Oesophagostomum dentatum TaxID=61180 RepID=A0A0B1S027_OESDE|nr:hypothetical protein OESDEN_23129 [Oesophagostomum dentatum]
MPRGTRVSLEEQSSASALSDAGFSVKKIAAQLGRSRCVFTAYLQNLDHYNIRNAQGRPRRLSDRQQREIWRKVSNSTNSLSGIRAELSLSVSRTTIWRTIKRNENIEIGVMRRVPSHLVLFLEWQGEQEYRFQQDNARIHVSRSTSTFLNEHSIPILDWPPCNPNVNPIENLCGILARKIYANNKQYRTTNELRLAVVQAWDSIEPGILENLANSMPSRLFELISGRGGPINY